MHFAVARGELDAALELLKPVVANRAARGPAACKVLAGALVRAHRHAEAHAILAAVLEMFPTLRTDKAFAKQLRACEKKLGMPRTRLAATRIATRRMIVAATLVVLVVAGVVLAQRMHVPRVELHVVDSAQGRLTVAIEGCGALQFQKPGHQTIQLDPGSYVAHVSGAVHRDIPFEIRVPRWPAPEERTTFVLDASGDSLLWMRAVTYATQAELRRTTLQVMQTSAFNELPDVDFPFEKIPRTAPIPHGADWVTKLGVEMVNVSPEEVVFELLEADQSSQAFDFAQKRLARDPRSDAMLGAFVAAAKAGHFEQRADAALAKRLTARPCDVPAQRAWLEIHCDPQEAASVAKKIEKLAAAEPDEGTWALLAGLSSTSSSERTALLLRATADARVEPFALGPLAEVQASSGDWSAALASAQRAMQGAEGSADARNVVEQALLALGRTAELEQSLRERFTEDPCDFDALCDLVTLLVMQDGAASPAIAKLESEAAAGCRSDWTRAQTYERCAKDWARGDYDEVANHARASADPAMREWMACAMAEAGRVDDLRLLLREKKTFPTDPYLALAMALACRAAHDDDPAREWEKAATDRLGKSGLDGRVAHVLRSDRTKCAQAALDLPLRPREKAVVLAFVSFGDASTRVKLLEQALLLRPPGRFPHATIERLLADAKAH